MKHFLQLFLLSYTLLCPSFLWAQTSSLSGYITFEKEPALGAYVKLSEIDIQTVVDANGKFEFLDVPYGEYQLQISFVGAKPYTQNVQVTKKNERLQIELKASIDELAAVTIVGKSEAQLKKEQSIKIESVQIGKLVTEVNDISQAVDRMTGVRVQSSGSMGDRAEISLNGLNGYAVRIYKDGIPFEFLYPSLSLTNIPLVNLKRVDVYKGVVPVHVGSDATGGAINLVSDYKDYNFLNTSYGVGSFNTHQFDLTNNYAVSDHLIFNVNLAYNYSDNNYKMIAPVLENYQNIEKEVERFHDAYEMYHVNASMVVKQKAWADLLKLEVGYSDIYKELQHGLVVGNQPFGEFYYESENLTLGLDYEKELSNHFSVRNQLVYAHEHSFTHDTTTNVYNWNGEIVSTNPSGGEFANATLARRKVANISDRLNIKYQINDTNSLKFSVLFAQQELSGRDEIKSIENDRLVNGQELIKNITGLEYARLFFQEKLQIQLAAKHYYFQLDAFDSNDFPVSQKDDEFGYYGTLKYTLNKDFFIRTSYEKGLRIPIANEYFGNGANIGANTALLPEKSENLNLGLSYQKRVSDNFKLELNTSAFYRKISDLIFQMPQEFTKYQNQEGVEVKGIEAEFVFHFFKKFKYSVNTTQMEKVYTEVFNKDVEYLIGTPFPNTPTFFMNHRLDFTKQGILNTDDKLQLYAFYKYVDTFNWNIEGKTKNPDNWVPTQHRLDVGFTYTFLDEKFTFSANILNVLDMELYDLYSVPRAGRNYNMKIAYRLNNY